MSIVTDSLGLDPTAVATGPGRFLIAPVSAPVPTSPYDAVLPVANGSGYYPAIAPWRDTGLSVDAPSWTHSRETEGLEFQHVAGTLFDRITEVTRTLTAQISGITPENLALIENVPDSAITTIASSAGKPAAKKIGFGTYSRLISYRGMVMFERADDATPITEPGGRTRPPAIFYVLPTMQLSADEDSEFEVAKGEAVNTAVSFKAINTPGTPAGQNHGFWFIETPGVVTA